jgi:uncharacterized protein
LILYGSLALFSKSYFLWSCQKPEDISLESLTIFEIMNPLPENLIIGTGSGVYKISDDIIDHYTKLGVKVEVMTSVFYFYLLFRFRQFLHLM